MELILEQSTEGEIIVKSELKWIATGFQGIISSERLRYRTVKFDLFTVTLDYAEQKLEEQLANIGKNPRKPICNLSPLRKLWTFPSNCLCSKTSSGPQFA